MDYFDVARDLTLALINNGRLSDANAVNEAFMAILKAQMEAHAALNPNKTYSTVLKNTDELATKYRVETAG